MAYYDDGYSAQGTATHIVLILVAVIVLATVLIPVVMDLTDGETHTNSQDSWIAFDKTTDDFSFTVTLDDNTVDIDGWQGPRGLCVYADSLCCIHVFSNSGCVLVYDVSGQMYTRDLDSTFTVSRTSGIVVVNDGTATVIGTPSYCYVPSQDGKYGFYTHLPVYSYGEDIAAGGYFAGISTYNDMDSNGLGLEQDNNISHYSLNGVTWVKP